uniref:DM13 domain-containing protein n=1 Tax=Meloidogyne javanica TaxID=6303 RepID=A0A915LST4_MELJA
MYLFHTTLLLFAYLTTSTCSEYLGIPLGSLQNSSFPGISGNVWLANSTTLQINNFNIEPHQKQELIFAFISEEAVEPVKFLYKVSGENNGEQMLFPMKRRLDGGLSEHRLVAIAPHGTTIDQWKRFGLVTGKSKRQVSVVQLDKPIPQKFCCLKNNEKPDQGVIGDHYNAATGPILVEDSRTLVIQKFSLEANKAPDAWIFAGKGDVRQSTGKKAMVIGRDSLNKHCSLREYYSGENDLRVRLAPGQDIYQVDYLSLFCYQYDVDFGHVSFQLDPKENPVPAFIPELENTITANKGDPELLENNDLEGSC